jgi:tetratricopeptide (TPR) repeat protein
LQEAKLLILDFNHKQAGDYFEKRIDTTNDVDDAEEAYFHYFTAEDKEQVNEYGCVLYRRYFDNQIFRKAYDVGKQTEAFVGIENTEGAILNCLGQILHLYGQLDAALIYFELNLVQDRAAGDKQNEGTTLNNISQIYDAKGDYDTALRYLEQSLAITQQIGDVAGLATTLHNMGCLFWEQKQDVENAVACFMQAHQIFKQIGSSKAQVSENYLYDIKATIGDAAFEALVRGLG